MKTKTKKIPKVNNKTLIAAFDIGKTTHFGYLRAPDDSEVKPFSFKNTREDYEKTWSKMEQFRQEQGLEEIAVGFESTGPYAEPFINYMSKKPVKLMQVNPMHTKRLKEVNGNSPNKTDKKDPRVISDIMRLNHGLSVIIPQGVNAELRRLTQARERTTKDLTAQGNRLQMLMFLIFPEFYEIMKTTLSKSALFLLKTCPLPEDIVEMGIGSLTSSLKKISRGKLKKERAQELMDAARQSVGIDQGTKSIVIEIRYIVENIENILRQIDVLEKQMKCCLRQVPYSRNILSIKGVGIITAAGLIGEVGDFRAFKTVKELLKLAGLDLYEISSGEHKGKHRISKRGRSLMRKFLYCATLGTVKSNGIFHKEYSMMKDRGMIKMKAVVALSRKLLRVIYALVRDDTMYDANYCAAIKSRKVA